MIKSVVCTWLNPDLLLLEFADKQRKEARMIHLVIRVGFVKKN